VTDKAGHSGREQAREAVTKAREVVELLEHARELMAEENPAQSAIEPLSAAIREARSHATMLENWYRRTYD
jgi:hypothetical protein